LQDELGQLNAEQHLAVQFGGRIGYTNSQANEPNIQVSFGGCLARTRLIVSRSVLPSAVRGIRLFVIFNAAGCCCTALSGIRSSRAAFNNSRICET
jgi:hypothetical protein